MKELLCIAAAVVLVGCASVGTEFRPAALSQVQPGQTTMAQAAELLGSPPQQTVRTDNGVTTLIWRHVVAAPGVVTKNQSITLLFGPDGKLVRVGHLINVPISDADRHRLRVMAESTL